MTGSYKTSLLGGAGDVNSQELAISHLGLCLLFLQKYICGPEVHQQTVAVPLYQSLTEAWGAWQGTDSSCSWTIMGNVR